MKKTLMLLGLGAILAQGAFASSIGIGYGVTDPIFKNDEKGYFLPFVDYEYNGFYVNSSTTIYGLSFGYKLFEADNYKFSVYGVPFGGYKLEAGDMDPGYKGIDDRDTQFMGGMEFVYTFYPYDITYSVNMEYGKEGGNISFNLEKPYQLTPKFTLIPSISYVYFNDDIVDYYFGIDAHEKRKSSKINETYEGDAGYRYGISLTGVYQISDNISVNGFVGVTKLSDELSNSPIVDNDVISAVGGGVVYSF